MKKLILLAVALVAGAVCHANLPPNEVAGQMAKPEEEGDWSRLLSSIMTSNVVADWEFTDYGLVKFARSERLDATLIGYPFCKWRPYEGAEKEDEE